MHNKDQSLDTHYTIILGAEDQLGRAMAREIARKGCSLILVSTTAIDLQRFAIGLQLKEDVQVDAVKLDLSDKQAIQKFTDGLRDRYEIRALINNIACDWSVTANKCMSEIAGEEFLTRFRGSAMITLNLLPQMSKLASAYIQHIIPFPFRKDQIDIGTQQSIVKLYAFVKELEEQVKDTGISVSMVYPAPIKNILSEFELFDGISEEVNTITPGLIALKAINGMLRGDRLIIPGFRNKILFFLNWQTASWFRSAERSFGSGLQPSV
jgi:short-subunit dehydrogenase